MLLTVGIWAVAASCVSDEGLVQLLNPEYFHCAHLKLGFRVRNAMETSEVTCFSHIFRGADLLIVCPVFFCSWPVWDLWEDGSFFSVLCANCILASKEMGAIHLAFFFFLSLTWHHRPKRSPQFWQQPCWIHRFIFKWAKRHIQPFAHWLNQVFLDLITYSVCIYNLWRKKKVYIALFGLSGLFHLRPPLYDRIQ